MKHLLLIFAFSFVHLQIIAQFPYPVSKKVNQSDTFFGKIISDPYRWLENQTSSEVKQWVNEQSQLVENYFKKIPNSFSIEERIRKNTFYSEEAYTKKGDYYFKVRYRFKGESFVFYYTDNIYSDDWEELHVVKDLNIGANEHVVLDNYSVSKNSEYLAFTFDRNGSDWKEIKVVNLKKSKNLADHLYDVRFSDIVWNGDGFYYTRFDQPYDSTKYTEQIKNAKLYYHKLGTKQESDSLIFKRNDSPYNFFHPTITADGRYLIIEDYNHRTNIFNYYYSDLIDKEQAALKPLVRNSTTNLIYLGGKENELFFATNVSGVFGSVVCINPQAPQKWKLKINAIEGVRFKSAYYYEEQFFVVGIYNQEENIIIFDKSGTPKKTVNLAFGSHYAFRGYDNKNKLLLFGYQSYLHPPALIGMDVETGKFKTLASAKVNYEFDDYEVKKYLYKSDTSIVPLLVMQKKNVVLDGNNPVLLEFYGGYGTSSEPYFDPAKIMFIESGGIYAYAMIRGGGEKGQYWHVDAIKLKKQNSITDIVKGVEFLIEKKYTNPSKIAISGGSHGGLLAAAAAIQRPDLFAAVIPKVGIYDMIRFENFTIGSLHQDEYGTVKDSLDFFNLLSYSPIHNVKSGIKYPAMLIMTSEYDDRVPPLHSYKLTATMQELASKDKPILLRIEKNSGHNGSRGYDQYIKESLDFYSFIFHNLGITKLSKY